MLQHLLHNALVSALSLHPHSHHPRKLYCLYLKSHSDSSTSPFAARVTYIHHPLCCSINFMISPLYLNFFQGTPSSVTGFFQVQSSLEKLSRMFVKLYLNSFQGIPSSITALSQVHSSLEQLPRIFVKNTDNWNLLQPLNQAP